MLRISAERKQCIGAFWVISLIGKVYNYTMINSFLDLNLKTIAPMS